MTREELKGCKSISISDSQKKLIEIYNEINESENAVCYLTSNDNDVIQSAIKALDILDKIRAEIAEEKIEHDLEIGKETLYNNAIDDVIEIIDKYRQEG